MTKIEITLTAGSPFIIEVNSVDDFIKTLRSSSSQPGVLYTVLGSDRTVTTGFAPSQLVSFRVLGVFAATKEETEQPKDLSHLNAMTKELEPEELLAKQKENQPLIDVFDKAAKSHLKLTESHKVK